MPRHNHLRPVVPTAKRAIPLFDPLSPQWKRTRASYPATNASIFTSHDADHFCEIITFCAQDFIAAIMRLAWICKYKNRISWRRCNFYGNCGAQSCMQGEKGERGSLRERCGCHFIAAAPH